MLTISPQKARSWIRGYGFERVRVGRRKIKTLLQKFLPQRVEAELAKGFKLELDLNINRQAYDFWFHEEDEAHLQWAIATFLPPGGTMIDCGANLGFFGIYAIHIRAARVHFIEPHPRLAAQIERSLKLNSYAAKGRIHQVAASSKNGTLPLYIADGNDGSHSLNNHAEAAPSVEVSTRRLDEIFRECGIEKIDFIKIDVEGHDGEVVRGLGAYLTPEKIRALYLEENNAEIFKTLTDAGYVGFQSHRYYIDALRSKNRRGETHAFFSPAQGPGTNLLWVPKGSASEELLNQIAEY